MVATVVVAPLQRVAVADAAVYYGFAAAIRGDLAVRRAVLAIGSADRFALGHLRAVGGAGSNAAHGSGCSPSATDLSGEPEPDHRR